MGGKRVFQRRRKKDEDCTIDYGKEGIKKKKCYVA
jgi:hypothetical protein